MKPLAPLKWQVPVVILLGIIVAVIIVVFHLSNASSYLSNKSEACINCHVMVPQYTTWKHSSHRENANCNDCHVPHDNLIKKYFFKAKDGLRHATIYTIGNESQVIHINKESADVVQQNCLRCHEDLLKNDKVMARNPEIFEFHSERKCWTCHREVPHGTVNSLSSVPNAQIPLPEDPLSEWLKN